MKGLHDNIYTHLILERGLTVDDSWEDSLESWDRSDCSEVGLVLVYLEYLISGQEGGVFGERGESLEKVKTFTESFSRRTNV
ncbi:hypothetical protein KUA24_126 [Vibrio phage HNL01]|nr:hypothetical protein KUA24_126 [Vibrio phage HNL01]